ncbi:MAG: hypothetical protein FWC98_02620 [Bacteroidales bacterium]|nr:hypothetical protein [Bacteroidales bacterium]
MPKLDKIDIVLDEIAYFGIQSPFSMPHSLAHFINKIFDIKLAKTIDFESYATGNRVDLPCYIYVSETEKCTYYFIGNSGASALFSNYPDMNFWFLVEFEEGLSDQRLSLLKEKLHNELSELEQVFLVVEADESKLAKFDDFKIDFSEYQTKLLHERKRDES